MMIKSHQILVPPHRCGQKLRGLRLKKRSVAWSEKQRSRVDPSPDQARYIKWTEGRIEELVGGRSGETARARMNKVRCG